MPVPWGMRQAAASHCWIEPGQRRIGSITRPKARTNPLFLSPGHRVSVESTTQQGHTLITTFKKAGAAGLMTAAPVPTQETFSS